MRRADPAMQDLDRLPWEAGLAFRAYGVTAGLRASHRSALPRLLPHLPYGWREVEARDVDLLFSFIAAPEGSDGVHALYRGWSPVIRSPDLARVLSQLETHTQMYVAELAPEHVFIHAGVVGWRGRAILIPGRSFTGKSTLVAELVRAGADYYSDEYAVLDRDRLVHPFPRPLLLRGDDAPRRVQVPQERIGAAALPVGLVVLTRYEAGSAWQPRTVTPGQAILHLLDNAIPAHREPERTLAALHAATERAVFLQSPRGEARVTAEAILTSLGD